MSFSTKVLALYLLGSVSYLWGWQLLWCFYYFLFSLSSHFFDLCDTHLFLICSKKTNVLIMSKQILLHFSFVLNEEVYYHTNCKLMGIELVFLWFCLRPCYNMSSKHEKTIKNTSKLDTNYYFHPWIIFRLKNTPLLD